MFTKKEKNLILMLIDIYERNAQKEFNLLNIENKKAQIETLNELAQIKGKICK